MFALAGAAVLSAAGLRAAGEPAERVVRIVARRFSYSPSQLALKRGVPVVLELVSEDVLMGFNLPDFNVRADILPGQVAKLRFIPDKAGTFVFLCDVFCGSGHETMSGSVTVA